MARCRHGFELSRVECPAGCGGIDKPQHLVTKVANPRVKVERNTKRPPGRFTDEQLREALTDAPNVAAVAKRLASHFVPVRDRAKAVPELWALYRAARERGLSCRVRPTASRRSGV